MGETNTIRSITPLMMLSSVSTSSSDSISLRNPCFVSYRAGARPTRAGINKPHNPSYATLSGEWTEPRPNIRGVDRAQTQCHQRSGQSPDPIPSEEWTEPRPDTQPIVSQEALLEGVRIHCRLPGRRFAVGASPRPSGGHQSIPGFGRSIRLRSGYKSGEFDIVAESRSWDYRLGQVPTVACQPSRCRRVAVGRPPAGDGH